MDPSNAQPDRRECLIWRVPRKVHRSVESQAPAPVARNGRENRRRTGGRGPNENLRGSDAMSDYKKGHTYTLECGHTVSCGCVHKIGDPVLCMECWGAREVTEISDDD